MKKLKRWAYSIVGLDTRTNRSFHTVGFVEAQTERTATTLAKKIAYVLHPSKDGWTNQNWLVLSDDFPADRPDKIIDFYTYKKPKK